MTAAMATHEGSGQAREPRGVAVAIDGGVATVTLARPEVHNAFDEALIADLTRALKALDADPAVRVVVLAGEGRSFCAGADLNWMQRMAGSDHRKPAAELFFNTRYVWAHAEFTPQQTMCGKQVLYGYLYALSLGG